MQAYKRMSKAATFALFASGVVGVGGIASIAAQAHAQAAVTNSAHERGFDRGNHAPVVLPEGAITEKAAKALIATAYPTVTIKHIRLESENNTVVYSAQLSDNTEAIVDARSGVVSLETEEQEQLEHRGSEHVWQHKGMEREFKAAEKKDSSSQQQDVSTSEVQKAVEIPLVTNDENEQAENNETDSIDMMHTPTTSAQ